MSSFQEITSEDEWQTHVSALPSLCFLVVSFHAPWAAPCAQMKEVLGALASLYPVHDPPSTSWVSINAEELSEISETYDVTAVPFLVLQRDGKVLETVSGSNAVKVREAIERHADKPAAANGVKEASATATKDITATTNGSSSVAGEKHKKEAAVEIPSDPVKAKEELFKRLEELVKAAPVMLFMKGTPSAPQCGFSRQTVGILRDRSVKYGFFNILADDEVRQGLKEFAEWPTYPQLWVDGELVGGLDIIKEELEANPDFLKAYSVAKE